MKPPPRKRTRTSRELRAVPEHQGRSLCKWPGSEQRKLLTALTKLRPRDLSGEPLDPERVKERLPSRTLEEINSVLDSLKEKVVLFAKTKQRAERREQRRDRRPLELWMQEASAVSGGQVEEALSLAFTQVLTVASTEPCSLKGNTSHIHHSTDRPLSKGMCPASNPSPLLSQSPSVSKSPSVQSPVVTEKVKKPSLQTHATRHDRKAQSSVVPSTHPQLTARITALPSSMGEVSFEKIYQYLSALHRPSQPCKLSPMESAVVLDLLMALPEELLVLDSDPLIQRFTQSYQNLLSGADKMVKQQQPAGIPPPNHQQSPTGLTDHNQPPQTGPPHHQPPPNGPPDHHQPSSRPTNHQQPPTTGPTEHQQPPTTGPTEHQQPPTTGPTEHQLPTTGSTAKQDPPTAPTNHQPPPTRPTETQGDSSIRNTSLRQNAPLNPFLIPVSLMSRKAQTDT